MTQSTAPSGALTELPGHATSYVLAAGGGRAHLLIDQVGRCIAGAEETSGAWSMMRLEGPVGRPIPLHFHRKEYEFFYCDRGTVQLWLDGESRILGPGDFGYAPPGTLHAYGLLRHHSGFFGPVIPGGWDRFFDLTGIPYSGVAPFPVGFKPEIQFAKFGQAEQEFDMKYEPEAEYVAARDDAPDDQLPGASRPYFLRAGEGPRHVLGGALVTSLCTAAESEGHLSMVTLELPPGAGVPAHVHDHSTEGLFVLEGGLRVWLAGQEHLLGQGDYASIPPGCPHRWEGAARFTKALAMSTPGGVEALVGRAGEPTELHMFPDEAGPLTPTALAAAGEGVDVRVP
jgi:quercetin 2,3-dioxygenase